MVYKDNGKHDTEYSRNMVGSERTAGVCIVALIVMLSIGATPAIVGAQENGTPTTAPTAPENASSGQTISVRQIEDGTPTACVAVKPLGDGTQSVEEFYGYAESPDVSAAGSRNIQYSDTSQIMFYNGTDGLSLVIIHDKYGDKTPGGSANMTITNLPDGGEWPVRDDPASAEFSGDDLDFYDNSAVLNWTWGTSRTDGVVFRAPDGEFDETRIVPDFNKSDENIKAWGLRSANQSSLIKLDMESNVTFSTGECSNADTANTTTEQQTPTISLGSESSGSGGDAASSNNSSSEIVESNPQSFVVTDLKSGRSSVAAGQPLNITATVENQADTTMTGNVVFRTSSNSTTERTVQLAPGKKQYIQFQRTYEEAGSYTLRAGEATLDVQVKSSSATGAGFGILPGIIAVSLIVIVVRARTGDN